MGYPGIFLYRIRILLGDIVERFEFAIFDVIYDVINGVVKFLNDVSAHENNHSCLKATAR